MSRLASLAFFGVVATLTGCVKDQSLSPPAENEYVTVSIKVPPQLEARPMWLMYRSSVCKQRRYDSAGRLYEVKGFHGVKIQPQRIGNTDLFEAKLGVSGGGQCEWYLSNVTFGVVHATPSSFGDKVVNGGGGGVVVMFDDENSGRGGADFVVNGDLTIRKDYYPWVSEVFLGGYRNSVKLFGGGYSYMMYRAKLARNVYFEPVVHSGFITYSTGPKLKGVDNNSVFMYPDGRVVADGSTEPDLQVLEAIRVKAESKK